MKIVDAKPPKSKTQELREIAEILIKTPNKAVHLDVFNEVHTLGKIIKNMGYKATWRKQTEGGWLVWARK